jgi:hypothetical protein
MGMTNMDEPKPPMVPSTSATSSRKNRAIASKALGSAACQPLQTRFIRDPDTSTLGIDQLLLLQVGETADE